MDEALLVLRAWLGLVFVVHAVPKLVPPNRPPTWVAPVLGKDYASGMAAGRRGGAEAFARLGVPWPGLTAATAGATQLIGAVLVATGWGARAGATLLVLNMIGAVLAKRHNGLVGAAGYEYPLTLLVCALPILVAGPGSYTTP
ncbi:DoxX family protein [Euzebya pacifica]|uniref:DoxX family protein n=1 Tax=Euzebya pacifica TaxID=1608957 RepID=UPI0030F73666